jgi:hypothetical protein
MKLYAWQPKGHGELSFFVCAENEQQAREAVEREIARPAREDEPTRYFDGWGTDYYELTVAEPLQVITNDNT